jgi:hypothetical protein
MGKFSRDKGSRYERHVRDCFRDCGFDAKRVPLSGAADGFPGDVIVTVGNGNKFTYECKKRKDGFKQLYKWLTGNDGVVVAADNRESLVVITLSDYLALLNNIVWLEGLLKEETLEGNEKS